MAETAFEMVLAIMTNLPEAEALNVAALHYSLEVGGKGFGWYMDDHHGDGRLRLDCKALPGVQEALIAQDSDRYYYPTYGFKGWVGVWLDVPGVDWDQIRTLLEDAHAMTLAKVKKPKK